MSSSESQSKLNTPSTFEAQYVAKTVGTALTKGLAEIVLKRPTDPVEYLANFLYKYVENTKLTEKDRQEELKAERLKQQRQQEEQRREEMRREREEIRRKEEEARKEKEAEERRRKELEELAKRKEEVANQAPPLPSLAEEEDQIVEFGQTKLHQLATQEGANLTILLKESHHSLAARNAQFKTVRDVAQEANQADNVKQIDEFIWELVSTENFKQLTDLLILGFDDDLMQIIESKFGTQEQMNEKGLVKHVHEFYSQFPQIQAKIRDIKNNIEKNDLEALKVNLDRKNLAFYRDSQGKSALHHSIEKKHFEIALYLYEKYPVLSKLNDCFEKYPVDYLKAIDTATLDENQLALYEQLSGLLN